ncbi:MAG: hypothetical protein FWC11_00510 [Firmicutes bacterium]|nr:hypothetical protein [Bacillota bacterium]
MENKRLDGLKKVTLFIIGIISPMFLAIIIPAVTSDNTWLLFLLIPWGAVLAGAIAVLIVILIKVGKKDLPEHVKIHNMLNEFYKNNESLEEMYFCEFGEKASRIPFLVKKNWMQSFHGRKEITFDEDVFLKKEESEEVDNIKFCLVDEFNAFENAQTDRIIEARIADGSKLVNNPALYTSAIKDVKIGIEIEVKKTRYFPLCANLTKMEEDIKEVVGKTKNISQAFLKNFKSLDKMKNDDGSLKTKPLPVGATAAIFLKGEEDREWRVALHGRSKETATCRDIFSTAPSFGLSLPFVGWGDDAKLLDEISKYDIVKYNLVKELMEELFQAKEDKNDPFAFQKHPEYLRLVEKLKDSNCISVQKLGFGFNAFNSAFDFAFAIIVKDREYADYLENNMMHNCEFEGEISFVKVDLKNKKFLIEEDKEFETKLNKKSYIHNPSLFAIGETLKILK